MNSYSPYAISSALLEEAPVSSAPSMTPPGHTVAGVTHRVLTLRTKSRFELINLTDQVQEIVRSARAGAGLVLVSSMHTTCALMVNEWQAALLEDIKALLGDLVPSDRDYQHNDPRRSDCDRKNAHAHLRATLLGHSLSFGVAAGQLALGQFQAIIAAELDGPRERQVGVQVISFA